MHPHIHPGAATTAHGAGDDTAGERWLHPMTGAATGPAPRESGHRQGAALGPQAKPLPAAPSCGLLSASEMPPVREADARRDRAWFAEHEERSFRSRPAADGGVWIVRRAGGVLLRTVVVSAPSPPPHDGDRELGPLWFATAWPELSAEEARRRGRRAARQGRRDRP
jgi:hypothetical protein